MGKLKRKITALLFPLLCMQVCCDFRMGDPCLKVFWNIVQWNKPFICEVFSNVVQLRKQMFCELFCNMLQGKKHDVKMLWKKAL